MALNKTLAHLYFIASHVFLLFLKGVKVSALSGRYNLRGVILEKCRRGICGVQMCEEFSWVFE